MDFEILVLSVIACVLVLAAIYQRRVRKEIRDQGQWSYPPNVPSAKVGFFSNPDHRDAPLARWLLILLIAGTLISAVVPDGPSGSAEIRQAVQEGKMVDCKTREECIGQFWSVLFSGLED